MIRFRGLAGERYRVLMMDGRPLAESYARKPLISALPGRFRRRLSCQTPSTTRPLAVLRFSECPSWATALPIPHSGQDP